MRHATIQEIHDHAYGFHRSGHVGECPACVGLADTVVAERDALREALQEEAPELSVAVLPPIPLQRAARSRFAPPAVAAAVLLLGALAWMLFQPSADRSPAPLLPLRPQEEEIQRLLGELRSKSALRQEIARLALQQYGGTALEALERSEADPKLALQIRGVTADDQAMLARMKKATVSLHLEHGLYTEAVAMLEPVAGRINMEISGHDIKTAYVTLHLEKVTLEEAIKALAGQLNVPFGVQYGAIVLGTRPEPAFRAPLRISTRPTDLARHIADLSSDTPARRDQAARALRRMGWAAERALWDALDAEGLETRSRAAALLKEIYGAEVRRRPALLPGETESPRVNVNFENKSLDDAVRALLAQIGRSYSYIWDGKIPVDFERVSFAASDLPIESMFALMLTPRGLTMLAHENGFLLTTQSASAVRTPPPQILWLPTPQAREIEPLIADLASADPVLQETASARFRQLEPSLALGALASAAGFLEEEALGRCQKLRQAIAVDDGVWISDLPSGADLQKLTAAQKALLSKPVTLFQDALELETILSQEGVQAEFRAKVGRFFGVEGTPPSRSTLLKLILRPRGLDFYLQGETVVIDTTAKVRDAVEK